MKLSGYKDEPIEVEKVEHSVLAVWLNLLLRVTHGGTVPDQED
jgi:hypothetical protein